MRGNADAVASAYSLDDYRIADDLGGEAAYANLRDRAWARGIRLASDMVPNHMGIDSRWVIEHPEWFLSLAGAALPGLHVQRARPVVRRRGSGSSSRTTTGTTATRRSCSSGSTAGPATSATSTTATTARASRGTTRPSSTSSTRPSASRSSGRSSTSPGASRSSASTPRWSSPRSTSSGCGGPSPGSGGGDPVARRARHPEGASSTRGCRSSSGARSSTGSPPRSPARSCSPRRSGCSRATSSGRSGMHRVYNSAFMHMLRDEDDAGLPEGHQGDPRVRPGDPQALRQLHEQPRREDRGRAVRQGRQVLRRGDGAGDAARAADVRPRPGRGLRREVRHGVPPGDARRAARSVAGRAPRARDLPAAPPAGLVRRGATTSCCTTSSPTAARSTRTSSPTRTARAPSARWSSTTTASRSTSGLDPRVGAVRAQDARRRASGWSGGRWPRASACRTTRRRSSRSATPGPGWSTCARAASSGSAACDVSLDAYERHVFWEFREVRDGAAGQWARLAARLGGRGVPSLDDALRELQLEPVHAPLRAVFADGLVGRGRSIGTATTGAARRARARGSRAFLAAIAEATGVDGDPATPIGRRRPRRETARRRRVMARRRRRRTWTARDRAGARSRWLGAVARPGDAGAGAPTSRPTSRGLVRRAAPAPAPLAPGCATPASTKARRGPSPTRSGSCSRCPPSAIARRGARPPTRGCSSAWLADDVVRTAIGRQHLGGRRVARPRPVRGAARLGRPPRRDRGRRPTRTGPAARRIAAAARPAAAAMRRLPASTRLPARGDGRATDGDAPTDDRKRLEAAADRAATARGERPPGAQLEQDPPQQRRRRRAVGDDRLEVRRGSEARRLAEAADDRGSATAVAARVARRRPRRGGAPRARGPTSPSSPRSRSTAGSTTAAPGRTWRAPRPPPGSRRRPSARRPRPRSSRRSGSGRR